MIKNVIFDVGNVLVDFCWEEVFHKLGFEGEIFEHVADATVRSATWNEFDRGAKPDEEIIAACIKEAPDYEREIRLFYDHVGDTIRTYPYTVRWIRSLEKNGYHTYILSNFPKSTYEKATEELSFEKETTGAIFSYQVKCIKPETEIYKLLLDRYHLVPQECVFIDDRPENIEAAEKLGITGIQFQNQQQAKRRLLELGVVSGS